MAWNIEFTAAAEKSLERLGRDVQVRIIRFLRERVANADNPRATGKPLAGATLSGMWRYRVGDYRVFCRIEDENICVIVIRVGHRRDVYRHG